MNRFTEAHDLLETARLQSPTSEAIAVLEAQLLYTMDQPLRALQIIDEAVAAGIPPEGNLAPVRFEALHQLGRSSEAWDFIAPLVAGQSERRLDVLGNVGISLYVHGKVAPARAVFEQLREYAPQISRFSTNLGFILTGAGELQEAKNCLVHGLETNTEQALRPTILTDLGYLYLIKKELPRADDYFREALSLVDGDNQAILRVAYWRNGEILPDEIQHPSAFIPVRSAVQANQVTLSLAQGRASQAEALAKQILAERPDIPVGYMIYGWVLFALGQQDAARHIWEQALDRTRNDKVRLAISSWLGQSPE